VGIVLGCVLLGWIATSTLGPHEDAGLGLDADSYDAASGGVLTDPSGFGAVQDAEESRAGIIGTGDELEAVYQNPKDDKPSVSGALSELHQAVTDKLQSLNPYQSAQSSKANKTSLAKGKRPGKGSVNPASLGEYINDGIKEEDRLGARTRVGKCTILFNSNSYWERAIRTHEEHDKKNGYRLHVLRQTLLDDVWSKPAYILSLLLRELGKPESDRLEWLFWVDADTIILNPYIPIETLLPPPGSEFDDVHLMYSNDWNGLNNGVFPVRVNQWAVQLFSAIVSFRHYKPEDPLVFRDQSAMSSVMQEPEFAKHIVQAPQRWFNAYQGEHNETLQPFQIRRGDLLVHFAGVPGREERMGYWLDRAEQHLDDWEIPVKSTSYPREAKDFWSEQRDIRKNKKITLAETRLKATQLLTTTDERLDEYGNRLTEGQLTSINEQREALKKIIEDEKWADNLEKVEEATNKLSEVCTPLRAAIGDSNKLLLKAAHEAIFAGEKDLLEAGFGSSADTPDMNNISVRVKELKNLVMSPEEFWSKKDITVATDSVTEARAKLQEIKAGLQMAAAKAVQEQTDMAKQLEEAKKMVQLEADQAAAAAGGKGILPYKKIGETVGDAAPPLAAVLGVPPVLVETIAAPPVVIETIAGPVVTVTPAAMLAAAAPPIETVDAAVVTMTPQANVVAEAAPPGVTVVANVITVTPEAIMVWTTAMVVQDSDSEAKATAFLQAMGN